MTCASVVWWCEVRFLLGLRIFVLLPKFHFSSALTNFQSLGGFLIDTGWFMESIMVLRKCRELCFSLPDNLPAWKKILDCCHKWVERKICRLYDPRCDLVHLTIFLVLQIVTGRKQLFAIWRRSCHEEGGWGDCGKSQKDRREYVFRCSLHSAVRPFILP